MPESNPFEAMAGMDVYLIDQFMKGRIQPNMRVLDAGAGGGRNILWMLRNGFDVSACEPDSARAEHLKSLFAINAPALAPSNVSATTICEMPFQEASFDIVICNAVLHFADDATHWHAMVDKLWSLLAPRGLLFARLASKIGVERFVREESKGWYGLPDGSRRYLVDQEMLEAKRQSLGGELAEPIKSTVVQNLRSMTTWVLRK